MGVDNEDTLKRLKGILVEKNKNKKRKNKKEEKKTEKK